MRAGSFTVRRGQRGGNQDHVWTGDGAAVQGGIHTSVVGVSS